MDRAWKSGARATPPTAPSSPSIGHPTSGDAGAGVPATVPGDWWHYMLTEELRNVIVAAGLTPLYSSVNQLLAAILALIDQYGFGRGQTVQNMISLRVTSTVYYNTTNRPIEVKVTLTSISNAQATGGVGGVPVYGSDAGVAGRAASISFVVPPGVGYFVNPTGFSSIQSWVELR